jgi:ribulose-phosphate 3-epimerase
MLLVMTVYPGTRLFYSQFIYLHMTAIGRGGQKFLERCVPKVAELRARFPQKDIEVDGGVGPATIGVCADAGSNVIVAGTAIFGAEHPDEVISGLKATVNTAQSRGLSK